jgi:hypothetical protein
VEDSEEETPPELAAAASWRVPKDPSDALIVFQRVGVGTPLEVEGIPTSALPPSLQEFIKGRKPRVELFSAAGRPLQDSVTADQLNTPDYEFMQGVFFAAGLDPRESASLFTQNDKTVKALDKASSTLTTRLRELWAQGTNLTFELDHQGSTIQFMADDPAIAERKVRMSKRSDGVTQFFKLSMILYARQLKHPANAYLYLFDEPGIYLHTQGQKDLIQVFELLAAEVQIVYATHSIFMLNQNFPERHRLVFKDEAGTHIDHKPYRANWRLATDALGVTLTSSLLFASKIILVEGDSDPIYLLELFRQLIALEAIDADVNMLGIKSFYTDANLRFLVQMLKPEGRVDPKVDIVVVVDGDSFGSDIKKKTAALLERTGTSLHSLSRGKSIEDYALYEAVWLKAVVEALRVALVAEGKPVPEELDQQVQDKWSKRDDKLTAGAWFKAIGTELIGDEASKVGLARTYATLCRESALTKPESPALGRAKTLCRAIADALTLPSIRAAARMLAE